MRITKIEKSFIIYIIIESTLLPIQTNFDERAWSTSSDKSKPILVAIDSRPKCLLLIRCAPESTENTYVPKSLRRCKYILPSYPPSKPDIAMKEILQYPWHGHLTETSCCAARPWSNNMPTWNRPIHPTTASAYVKHPAISPPSPELKNGWAHSWRRNKQTNELSEEIESKLKIWKWRRHSSDESFVSYLRSREHQPLLHFCIKNSIRLLGTVNKIGIEVVGTIVFEKEYHHMTGHGERGSGLRSANLRGRCQWWKIRAVIHPRYCIQYDILRFRSARFNRTRLRFLSPACRRCRNINRIILMMEKKRANKNPKREEEKQSDVESTSILSSQTSICLPILSSPSASSLPILTVDSCISTSGFVVISCANSLVVDWTLSSNSPIFCAVVASYSSSFSPSTTIRLCLATSRHVLYLSRFSTAPSFAWSNEKNWKYYHDEKRVGR